MRTDCDVCGGKVGEHDRPVPGSVNLCESCATRLVETERAGRWASLAHAARLTFGLSVREWEYLSNADRAWYLARVIEQRIGDRPAVGA